MRPDNIESLNIQSLFSSSRYIIPIYQRNYAWGEKEITQLLQDILDFAKEEPTGLLSEGLCSTPKEKPNYHIGTLVVYERKLGNAVVYETIDGQQRLTTLNILLSVLKREYASVGLELGWYSLNLEFDSRQASTETLQLLAQDSEQVRYADYKEYNHSIQQAYNDIKKALARMLAESGMEVSDFYDYLTQKVFILRVPVPHDTDLNHYFEIMNSRGEQLEKHEILKASFLELLKDDRAASHAFHQIWEACADMERYVQYGFKVKERDALFTANDWNSLTCSNLEEISQKLKEGSEGESTGRTILEIVGLQTLGGDDSAQSEDGSERFSTVINFSNFLLHVLRIQTGEEIPLDDKRLLKLFEPYRGKNGALTRDEKISFAKEFGFNLLKCKLLFDKYILKREYVRETDQWSLKRLKRSDKRVWYVNTFGSELEEGSENKEILMLLSMFHVSSPTLVYKHWLNAALYFLFRHPDCAASEYKGYLERLALSFFIDRFMLQKTAKSKDGAKAAEPLEYFEIIFTNDARPQAREFDEAMLHNGTAVENFVFNYLDWLLWKNEHTGLPMEFTFRSSVEHYYPQNPKEGHARMPDELLHHFGNLCLLSASKNSALSNYMPTSKKEHYEQVKPDSIKQQLMMRAPNWGAEEIEKHGQEMIRVFRDEVKRTLMGGMSPAILEEVEG